MICDFGVMTVWTVMLAVLLYIVWFWMHVNDHVTVSLVSDIVVASIADVVTFTGAVDSLSDTGEANASGTLDGTDSLGGIVSLPFTTDESGTYVITWTASLPAGVWTFIANVAGVASNPLTITQNTAMWFLQTKIVKY